LTPDPTTLRSCPACGGTTDAKQIWKLGGAYSPFSGGLAMHTCLPDVELGLLARAGRKPVRLSVKGYTFTSVG